MTLQKSSRLGPYEVVELLGAGGMGEVYRARDTRLDRDVALKILPSSLAGDEQYLARFNREARAISLLNHPHVCTLYDIGHGTVGGGERASVHSESLHYLVMELVEGDSLADRLRGGPLPLHEVLRYGAQIAEALDAAHRRGIVHRDLKPGNIMLTKSGAKLLDFGLARGASDSAVVFGETDVATEYKPITKEGMLVGTFQYMAPEQLEGLEADARTDIFALGAVLYEMATGRRAFEGTSKTSLIAAIVSGQPKPIASLAPMAPPALEHVVTRCLEKDPNDRWQSAHDVAAELRWVASAGSQAGVAAPVVKRRRHREGVAWFAAALLAIAAVGAAVWGWNRTPGEPRPTYIVTAVPDEMSVSGPAVSPDGRSIAYSLWKGQNGQLYVRSFDEREPRLIEGAVNAVDPFYSPDGRWIAYWADRAVRKVAVNGGAPLTITEVPRFEGGNWGEDGTIVFSQGPPHGLWKVPASGGTAVEITKTNVGAKSDRSDAHMNPQILPGGRSAVFSSWAPGADPDSRIAIADIESGSIRFLMTGISGRYSESGHLLYTVRAGAPSLVAAPFDLDSLETRGEASVIATNLSAFDVSPSGTLSFLSLLDPPQQIVWAELDGRREAIASVQAREYQEIAVSPDGRRAVVTVQESAVAPDIWLLDLERGTSAPLTSYRGYDAYPVWSPDGNSVVFASDRAGPPNLYRVSVDGGEPERLTEAYAVQQPLGFTPDGRKLVLGSARLSTEGAGRQNGDIEVLDLESGEVSSLIASDAAEWGAALSPDGSLIAYVSDESGEWELYVRSFPSLERKRRVSTKGISQKPVWALHGRALYYRDEERRIVMIPVDGGSFGAPEPLFEARETEGMDIAPDGKRLLLTEPAGATKREIVTILNWSELLRKK